MNEKIQRARDAGLELLRPGPRDLDRGLELHADSIVCEAYGFAPRAAVDGEALRAAVEAGASEAELADMISEMQMTRCVSDPAERAEFVEAFEAAGVTCILQNAGEEGNAVARLLKRLARFTYVTDMMPGFLRRGVTPDDIVAAKREGRRCLYLTGNGVPLPQEWVSVEEELRYVRVFFQLGIRMMHLTYNRRNAIGDGCNEPADGGLSDFGRAAVAEMNRVGVIVDVAHSGRRTGLEAAGVSTGPVVASHSGCAAVNSHPRCKPDEVIRAIAETGGYVGICCVPAFLGGTGDVRAVLDHIDHLARTVGTDHIAIGTDVAYGSRNADAQMRLVPERRRSRAAFEAFWPPGDPLFDPKRRDAGRRLSMAWTNWPLFTVGLVQRGYGDEDIRKIVGGNVLRVARAVLPEAPSTGGYDGRA